MKNLCNPKKVSLLMGLFMTFLIPVKAQEVNVYAFSSEPIIDGIIDDSWSANNFLEISHVLSNNTFSQENLSGHFKISWYNNNLYFLFEITDDVLALHKDQLIWLGDNINLNLDLGNEKNSNYDNNDYLCHFKWGNSDYLERYQGENIMFPINNSDTAFDFAQICDTINHKFVMEIAIRNIAELNGPPVLTDTTKIGIDASLYDSDDEFIYKNVLSWYDTIGGAWSDPSRLGTAGLASICLKSAKSVNKTVKSDNATFRIFPTIASDFLTIESTLKEDVYIEVLNLLGEKIESSLVSTEYSVFDISSLKNGFYIVNMYNSKDQLLCSQRIIKCRN